MEAEITELRKLTVEAILAEQDDAFRWGFDEKQARERPETVYYAPNFRSTLWTLLLLADLKAPSDLPQAKASLRLISEHFYAPEHGVFRLPGMSHFPIPCLNGNMIHLHQYFERPDPEAVEKTIDFFAATQRFDDGDFKTPKAYPYCSNTSCYGKHTCSRGVTKLLKGMAFIPKARRSRAAQQLIANCIEFVLLHEVCFSSHKKDKYLHGEIDKLTFPNFYKSDFLEILWLLAREDVHDERMARALGLLRSKRKDDGTWQLEKSQNISGSIGQAGCANAFITERANEVLALYGY